MDFEFSFFYLLRLSYHIYYQLRNYQYIVYISVTDVELDTIKKYKQIIYTIIYSLNSLEHLFSLLNVFMFM